MSFFNLLHTGNRARAGIIHTDHGDIETPMFMPVGTQASVKTLDQADLEKIGAQIILGNTYHLHLRPGEELIAEQGGLHKFMNWTKPILTDSGGFQVFSLAGKHGDSGSTTGGQGKLVAIDEDGVTFRSHIDGSSHRFTPETSVEIQHKIGADIIMAFDECTPDKADYEYTKSAMERTHRWAERSVAEHKRLSLEAETRGSNNRYSQFLFGIIQGAVHRDLREESARFITGLDFDGIAIGGESIGYNMAATAEILDWIDPLLPENKPRYAMGVGLSPADLLVAVEHGVDMFDCVGPTRLARHGHVFTHDKNFRLNLTGAACRKDTGQIDARCHCPTCTNYTRSYLHHLFAAQELSAPRLATIHNLYFMINLMKETRAAILENRFDEFRKFWRS